MNAASAASGPFRLAVPVSLGPVFVSSSLNPSLTLVVHQLSSYPHNIIETMSKVRYEQRGGPRKPDGSIQITKITHGDLFCTKKGLAGPGSL